MSRTSCISHPEGERLIIIRKWQLKACSQDACAAALLNLFEYWHNIKLEQKSQAKSYNEVAARHGENSIQIETLLQWHKSEQLETSLLHIFNKRRIQAAIELLENLKFISVHRNPNPRYSFDKTKHFLFHPNQVNAWLKEYIAKNKGSITEDDSVDSDNLYLSMEANGTYGVVKTDPSSIQIEPTVSTNLPLQYTKNTYQDDLQKLPTKAQAMVQAFDIFWSHWISITKKEVGKRKAYEIFTKIVHGENPALLHDMLEALELQGKEKELRQKLNLFTPQWTNPTNWLEESRWEDGVNLNEAFYRDELLRSKSGRLLH